MEILFLFGCQDSVNNCFYTAVGSIGNDHFTVSANDVIIRKNIIHREVNTRTTILGFLGRYFMKTSTPIWVPFLIPRLPAKKATHIII